LLARVDPGLALALAHLELCLGPLDPLLAVGEGARLLGELGRGLLALAVAALELGELGACLRLLVVDPLLVAGELRGELLEPALLGGEEGLALGQPLLALLGLGLGAGELLGAVVELGRAHRRLLLGVEPTLVRLELLGEGAAEILLAPERRLEL
jgi:hypothetical protein